MALLHLDLDIDSEVHPELYVRLASIERSGARQEKLRQLAATGLIWEIARLHGPAFAEPETITAAASDSTVFHLGDGFSPAIDAGAATDHAPRVPADVPMLVDVVDEAEMTSAAPPDDALALPVAAKVVSLRKTTPEASPSASSAEAAGGRTRSARIKRMKDSGLFQNG